MKSLWGLILWYSRLRKDFPSQRLLFWSSKVVFDFSYIYKNRNIYIIIQNLTDDILVNAVLLDWKLHYN